MFTLVKHEEIIEEDGKKCIKSGEKLYPLESFSIEVDEKAPGEKAIEAAKNLNSTINEMLIDKDMKNNKAFCAPIDFIEWSNCSNRISFGIAFVPQKEDILEK
jgi:hypothetical protein